MESKLYYLGKDGKKFYIPGDAKKVKGYWIRHKSRDGSERNEFKEATDVDVIKQGTKALYSTNKEVYFAAISISDLEEAFCYQYKNKEGKTITKYISPKEVYVEESRSYVA